MKSFYEKYIEPYKDVLAYIFWGVVTTIVNLITYHICYSLIGIEYYTSSVISWIVAVTVAYLTNRKWVFHSKAKGTREIAIEILKFVASRIASLIMEIALLFLGKDILHLDENLTKYTATILVVVLNYVLSKFFVFTIHGSDSSSPSLKKENNSRPDSPNH